MVVAVLAWFLSAQTSVGLASVRSVGLVRRPGPTAPPSLPAVVGRAADPFCFAVSGRADGELGGAERRRPGDLVAAPPNADAPRRSPSACAEPTAFKKSRFVKMSRLPQARKIPNECCGQARSVALRGLRRMRRDPPPIPRRLRKRRTRDLSDLARRRPPSACPEKVATNSLGNRDRMRRSMRRLAPGCVYTRAWTCGGHAKAPLGRVDMRAM